ncbi:MAG: cobalamin biosynthesis protein [Eubacteriales bacterium]|nr:cobalamin biosynthesis protein [Eubacteriales bacterium]
MSKDNYSFFQNTACEYFPCHSIEDPAQFNCLFCYCPLYMLGPRCGGNFHYSGKGVKVCTDCVYPHRRSSYMEIIGRFPEIRAAMQGSAEVPEERKPPEQPRQQKAAAHEGRQGQDGQTVRRIVMMACTERGFETMRRAADLLGERTPEAEIIQAGRCAYVPGFEDGPRLSQLTGKWFYKADALVFFAAAGIAVRCIAPFVRDKFSDPAVLAVDENGRFVIPLLSGHAGGANRLCSILSEAVGAQPVITTATDGRGLFAVDLYAAENGLQISDRALAKELSARLLAGGTISIYSAAADAAADGTGSVLPEDFGAGTIRAGKREEADIIISCRRAPGDREDALYLIPRGIALGIGCRKGTAAEAVEKEVTQLLQKTGLFRQSLCGIASIELKKEEEGILCFAGKWGLPVTFYTEQELNALPGTFTASTFVKEVTGVDCVCERSAVRLAGEGAVLLVPKQSGGGVTTALAADVEVKDFV